MSQTTEQHTHPLTVEVQTAQEPAELYIDHATLYHGSATPAITALDKAEEATVGSGVYLTASPEAAEGYARHRAANGDSGSVVYEVAIDKLRLANLSNPQMLQYVLDGYASILEEHERQAVAEDLPWYTALSFEEPLENIRQGLVTPGRVKLATQRHGDLFSSYLRGLGFDGLKTTEGGEGAIGDHDTYLIFDPSQAHVVSERRLEG